MTRVVADDILGKVARQQNDLFRRVREGTLDAELVSIQLQQIIEGRLTGPTTGEISSFADQIHAGDYDYLYGFAKNPERIKGQTYHLATSEVKLDHPAEYLGTSQVYEKYGDQIASLSELLDYGIRRPNVQRDSPVGIVWKDEDGQLWYAYLNSYDANKKRNLYIDKDNDPNDTCWHDECRFLVRK